MPLSAAQHKILSQLSNRHGQKKSPYFLVEGLRCCRELLQRRADWLSWAVATPEFLKGAGAEQFAGQPFVTEIPERDFRNLVETEAPQGILCVARKPAALAPDKLPKPYTLILDKIQEPGNMGTILRTSWALGLESVWLTSGCADPFAPKVVRAGMGAQFALELFQGGELPQVCEHFRSLGGTAVWCAMPEGQVSSFSDEFYLTQKSALVLGNEGNGIAHPEVGQAVTIPMPGHAESLNVAQAGTVLMFEALRKSQLNA